MAIVQCPRCRDEVTVPPGATSRALVRCPLCLEEYLLSEALANAPPPLIIIGGEVPQAAIQTPPVGGHDYELAETFSHSPDSHWGHAAAATLAKPTPAIRTGRRARRREPSIILMILNWVGGGILGLALAPLVLWWIFKVDPVELGPMVAVYVPWAVPQQFHGRSTIPPPEFESVVQPPRRRSKRASKADEPSVSEKTSVADELQSLPEFTQPAQPTEPASTAIELPDIKSKPTKPPTDANKTEAPREENALPRPPMPDLTDLLP